MNIETKYHLLCAASRYDALSPSRTGEEEAENAGQPGITYVQAQDGRAFPVLKLLFTNCCIYDCLYCPIRKSNNVIRTSFTVDEVVRITISMYRRRKIRGLFLSSGVMINPDFTSTHLLKVAQQLREKHEFRGYIHLKVIPGTSEEIIRQAGCYADRLSVNIELPSSESLQRLAPDKRPDTIFNPMNFVGHEIMAHRHEKRHSKEGKNFTPAGQSTQMIIGATPEDDNHILHLAQKLYRRYHLARIYYSAYKPVNLLSGLPETFSSPVLREHRLYQADWLMRVYGFQASEIVPPGEKALDEFVDPKTSWSIRNYHLFPVEINRVDFSMLCRIPGIGIKSAQKIIRIRRYHMLDGEDLSAMGVQWNKARHFITLKGKFYGNKSGDPTALLEHFRNQAKVIPGYRPLLPGLSGKPGASR